METIMVKACGFLFMIALGYVLKRIGVFSPNDSKFLSDLVLKVTLPMAIISNFRGLELNHDYLLAVGLGFLVNLIVVLILLFLTRKEPASRRAFYIINASGYNIGLCALPYLSSFFAAEAVALICMFDVGNAIMSFGLTFSIASILTKGKGGVSKKEILKTLFSSVPFVTYFGMILLCAAKIDLPGPVYTVAGMIGQANAFLAMLLIGILFELKIDRSEAKDMTGVFLTRMIAAVCFALLIYHFLPVSQQYRQVLAIVVFSPIMGVAPIYTERSGYHRSVAAVLNSLMLPFSLIIMTILLMILKVY